MNIITCDERLNRIMEEWERFRPITVAAVGPADLDYLFGLACAAAIHDWTVCPCPACKRKVERTVAVAKRHMEGSGK